MSSLRPGVHYHIQNVDSGVFLELADRTPESEVKTRGLKDSARQQWTLIRDPKDAHIFMLENVAHRSWLGVVTDGSRFSQLVGQSKTSANRWWIEGDDDGYQIGLAKSSKHCLELGEFGAVLIQKLNYNDNQRWRFMTENEAYQSAMPFNAYSLPTGFYRIRSLDGEALLILSGGLGEEGLGSDAGPSVASTTSPTAPGSSQKWLVTSNNDGTYFIQATEDLLYLACKTYDCYKYCSVYGLREPFPWKISPVAGFAYTINAYSLSTLLSVGFRDYRAGPGKQIVLTPRAQAHSQTWLFEKWEDYFEVSSNTSFDSISFGAVKQQKAAPQSPPLQGLPGGFRQSMGDPGPGMTPGGINFPNVSYVFPPELYSGPSEFPETLVSFDEDSGSDTTGDLAEGHYFIRNVGLNKYLDAATKITVKSEPKHASVRFLVRTEPESNLAQIIPHSYSGFQSLVWRKLKVVVEDTTEAAWKLISVEEGEEKNRFYLKIATSQADEVLGAIPELEMVDMVADDDSQLWDFIRIF